jgi:hypothetical protein
MTIEHVLAVVPTADFHAARSWYELAEWRVTDGGLVQLTRDADRAGPAVSTFASAPPKACAEPAAECPCQAEGAVPAKAPPLG